MAEDNCSQRLWPSPSLSPFLDSCLLDSLLDFPDNGDLSQFQYKMSPIDQRKLALLSSPCRGLNVLSTDKSPGDAQQLALDMQPDTLGTFIISVHDAGDRQESSALSLSPCSIVPEWTQHGSVVPGSPVMLEKTAGIQQVLYKMYIVTCAVV